MSNALVLHNNTSRFETIQTLDKYHKYIRETLHLSISAHHGENIP